MRIAIFGANGATGRLLTQLALDHGYQVTALLRNPAVFPCSSQVTVVEGSAFDPVVVARTIQGADAVFSALGAHSPIRNENVLPRAVPLILAAMQLSLTTQHPTRRIIVLGSAGALPDSLSHQPAWRRAIVQKIAYRYFLKWPVHEQIVQYLLLSSSGLDWTMVMPPMLTNGRPKGTYRISGAALPRNASHIARADIADFMFQQLDSSEWVKKGVYVSY